MMRTWILACVCLGLISYPSSAVLCRTRRCSSNAQSGHDGYCKTCFKKKFPKKYADKQARRQQKCVVCSQVRELVQKDICRPCFRARSCDKCGAVNRHKQALACSACFGTRKGLGSDTPRLALWCNSCTSPEERATRLCSVCLARVNI